MNQTNQIEYSKLYDIGDKKNIYASILILISLIVLFFFTKNIYFSKIENEANLTNLNTQLDSLKKELDGLNDIKNKLNSDTQVQKDIEKYAGDFREDRIFDSIFRKINGVSVLNISIDKGETLTNGLKMANIGINIEADSIKNLNLYLEYLTSEFSSIRYLIKSINFPFVYNSSTPFSASLSLGMYYF